MYHKLSTFKGNIIVHDPLLHDIAIIPTTGDEDAPDPSTFLINWELRDFCIEEHNLLVDAGLSCTIERPSWAPRVLDLFCGAGGFSLGFNDAYHEARMKLLDKSYKPPNDLKKLKSKRRLNRNWGHDLEHPNMDPFEPEIIGVDTAFNACKTYQHNRVGQAICADVKHLPFRPFAKIFDVIIGGPPCQPYSSLNTTKSRGSKHRLYDCVWFFLQWCMFYQPKVFVMENVPAIMRDPLYGSLFKHMTGQRIIDKSGAEWEIC